MNGNSIITIGEKPVSLYFGFSAHTSFIAQLTMFTKQYLDEDTGLTSLGLAAILLAGYENYCFNERVKPVLKFDEFAQYVTEQSGSDEFAEAIKEWSASNPVQKMVKESEKKNSPGTTLHPNEILPITSESATESLESNHGSSHAGL